MENAELFKEYQYDKMLYIRIDNLLMDSKVFCNPKYTIAELENVSGIRAELLLDFIHTEYRYASFEVFLIEMRLDEVEGKILKNPSINRCQLAKVCGFRNYISLQYYFIKRHGCMLGVWLKKLNH